MNSSRAQGVARELERLLCFNLYVGWRRVQAFYRDCFPEPLNPQRIYVLGLLSPEEGVRITDIAEALDLDLPAVSQLVARMEEEGLLERTRSASNRRDVLVVITPLGKSLRDKADRALRKADETLFRRISHADVAALRRIVAALRASTDPTSEEEDFHEPRLHRDRHLPDQGGRRRRLAPARVGARR